MGSDPDSVGDQQLRVRGMIGQRVFDATILLAMPAVEIERPVMAMA
jgi:choline dehydrogenase-like flavoprotein